MQSEEILDALEEYLGQYVGGTRRLAWQDPYRGDLFKLFLRPISRAMRSPPARPRSPAVPFGTSSSRGLSRHPPHQTSANSWTRSSSSGTPGPMRSIGTRKGCDGGHPVTPTGAPVRGDRRHQPP
jgi:hypothetical protein